MLAESASQGLDGVRIAAEVFVELLAGDDHSWLDIDLNLIPAPGVFGKQKFDFLELARIAAPNSNGGRPSEL